MKAKTLKEIARELGLSERSFYRLRKEKHLDIPKGLVSPYWQKVIYEALWYPDKATKKELVNMNIYE
jgi:hypothetical protein